DNLSIGAVEIDLIKLDGPVFKNVNERLVNLYLIAKGFSKAALFRPDGRAAQIKDFLYKKDIVVLRTKYRQKSLPNFDLFNQAVEQFRKNTNSKPENTAVLIEVLMGNVLDEESDLTIEDLTYFADRAEELCATGNNILVSNFRRNNHLAEFFKNFKPRNVGIATNVSNLRNIFNSDNYNKENYTNELLSYISGMFSKNVKLYAYPYLNKKDNQIITTKNLKVSEEAKPLYDFLIQNHYIVDIENYDEKYVKTL